MIGRAALAWTALARVALVAAALLGAVGPQSGGPATGQPAQPDPAADQAHQVPRVTVYVTDRCRRCVDATAWLAELDERHPIVDVRVRDVMRDPAALAELRRLAAERDPGGMSVPTFVVGDEVIVGFESDATTGRRIEALLLGESSGAPAAGAPAAGAPAGGAPAGETVAKPNAGLGAGGIALLAVAALVVAGVVATVAIHARRRRNG